MPKNIRLGYKLPTLANTLAFYNTATITAVKSFIVQAPGVLKTLGISIMTLMAHYLSGYECDRKTQTFLVFFINLAFLWVVIETFVCYNRAILKAPRHLAQ
jgi:hypothetical protein